MLITDDNGEVQAILLRHSELDHTEFFTDDEAALQFGCFVHAAGARIAPHRHNIVERVFNRTNEVILMRVGRMTCTIENDDRRLCWRGVISAGDVLLLQRGWHSFEIEEESVFLEVKNGPYIGEKDKTRDIL